MCNLISTLKKTTVQVGNEWSNIFDKILISKEKATTTNFRDAYIMQWACTDRPFITPYWGYVNDLWYMTFSFWRTTQLPPDNRNSTAGL